MDFAQRTIDLARQNVIEGGRPFATAIVRNEEVPAESANKVAQIHDPTAHAEILAIREACTKLGTEHLAGAHLRTGPSVSDVPGLALLLLTRTGRLPDPA